jgi:hypothetical protein
MTDQKYSCQGCTRDDLTLTRNGRVRSHAANGKRVGPDNPACPEGSNFPVQNTELHTHRFEYADDENGHSGSFCTVDDCGMAEPDEGPTMADDPSIHVPPPPPNPFRDPLPGGVHDNASRREPPSPRSVGMGDGPADASEQEGFPGLGEQPAGPYVPRGADDFLDGDENEEEGEDVVDDGPRFWPARYDGNCVSCGSHFLEGENIRRADGGYEAEDCCGPYAREQDRVEDRPKIVARTLPVVNGRYKLPDPETGKPITGGRASKYAEGIADSYALDQWRHRMILIGLLQDPEILEKVASGVRNLDPLEAVKARRAFLNSRAEEAMLAAGSKKRAEKGTTLHKYTEEVDAGQRQLEDVPEDYYRDAVAYRLALAECGFRPVKGLIERSVYSSELGVSGTFDRVLECVRDTEVLDLDGRATTIHAGEFVIGDVKSGDNIKSPWLEILIQEAIYAHALNENGVAVQDEPGGPFRWVPLAEFGAGPVREDVGVVMHVPYGSGECKFYPADLVTGWRGAMICKANRDFWKIELPQVPFATFSADHDPAESMVTTPEERDEAMAAIIKSAEDLGVISRDEPDPGEPGHVSHTVASGPEWAESVRREKEEKERIRAIKEAAAREMYEMDQYTCACGAKWDNIETANAYDHDTDGCGPDPDLAAPMPEWGELSLQQWTDAFKSAETRDQANDLWRRAKRAGVPDDTIKALVELVKLGDRAPVHQDDPKAQTAVSRPDTPSPTQPVQETEKTPEPPATPRDGRSLTDRAHAVTTKAEASAVFKEINDKIKTMPEEKRPAAKEYRDKLVRIMQDRLARA